MKLTPAERETVILFSDESDMATVYTHDKRMKSRLRKLSSRNPDLIYREERRTMAREHAKTAGYIPPRRGKSK